MGEDVNEDGEFVTGWLQNFDSYSTIAAENAHVEWLNEQVERRALS